METFARWVLALQSLPIAISGSRALFTPDAATAVGEPLAGVPRTALHIIGLTSLTLGATHLVLATRGSHSAVKLALGAMIPIKLLAAVYLGIDGMSGVALWEALSGIVYATILVVQRY
ncbi:hypothetical protein PT974_12182 [Cladobotryum mycophilum]|uniref:Uncharacterized protein n=1 Tax=Cladobotryum mycophilum TaxID=491253 RepID=A0ABR0S7B3_9HYPO